MSSSGMNTATSESVIDSTVKPTWRAPVIAAWIGGSPSSMRRAMFSTTTMASSTTKPVAMISAISDRLFRLKSHRYTTAKVPISETGTARLGISVARPLRRNRKTTRITSATEIEQGQLGLFQRRTDRRAAIVHHVQLDLRPEQFLQHRQLRVDGVGGLDDVGAGLAG